MSDETPHAGVPVRGVFVLLASCTLTLVLGSVHAFSVFLQPMELAFGATRAAVSFTYSLALVCLTLAVLVGHLAYGLLRPTFFAVTACFGAALGCVVAALSGHLWGTWFGYSVIFGTANGFGYGFALQISAQANPSRKALTMGIVTACYALGAALFPWILAKATLEVGIGGALISLALIIAVAGLIAAGLMHLGNAVYSGVVSANEARVQSADPKLIAHLWFAYGAGVSAGLMVIGHATGIAQTSGAPENLVVLAAFLVAVGNMAGGVAGGWMTDRIGTRPVITGLPILSVAGLATLLTVKDHNAVLAALCLTGFAYGAIIAVYPAAISYLFGTVSGVKAYGRVFTAWGTAGLIFPWLAGYLFDRSSSYTTIFAMAAVGSVLSAVAAYRLPNASAHSSGV